MTGFYNKSDYVLFFMILIFTLTLSTFLVINTQLIYAIIIKYLNLAQKYHVSQMELLHNFKVMTNFIQNPFANGMNLAPYHLSPRAYAHFTDVRKLVLLNHLLLVVSTTYLVIAWTSQKVQQQLWKLNDYIKRSIVIIGFTMLLCMIDFNDIFIYLHRLIFPNHNWVFNPQQDPIIKVLPDQYFLGCFVVWFSLVMILLVIFERYGEYQIKKNKH